MENSKISTATDISQIKRQLLQLKELHASGTLTDFAYGESRNRLERQLLDWVMNHEVADSAAQASSSINSGQPHALNVPGQMAKPPLPLIAGLVSVVIAVAGIGYSLMRNPSSSVEGRGGSAEVGAVSSANGAGPGKPHATNFDQIAEMTEKLSNRLKDNPQDAEGWAMLARSYNVLGRNPEALAAYEKASALRGDDAVLLADYADALALKNNRVLAGEPMKLVERALKIEPRNIKALSLAGTHAFEKKDYLLAVKHWEQVMSFGPANDPLVDQVLPGLTEARTLAGLPPIERLARIAKPPATEIGKKISGTVTLATSLASNAQPDDAIYIYARHVEGSKMPLALLQRKVKDLPIQFQLDDSMAMSPESTLSKAGRVTISARVSKSGNAMPQKGDLVGQSEPVEVGAKNIAIEIKEMVKQ